MVPNIKLLGPMVWAGEAVTELQTKTLTDSSEINIDHDKVKRPKPADFKCRVWLCS